MATLQGWSSDLIGQGVTYVYLTTKPELAQTLGKQKSYFQLVLLRESVPLQVQVLECTVYEPGWAQVSHSCCKVHRVWWVGARPEVHDVHVSRITRMWILGPGRARPVSSLKVNILWHMSTWSTASTTGCFHLLALLIANVAGISKSTMHTRGVSCFSNIPLAVS